MNLSYDEVADALYIRFENTEVTSSVPIKPEVIIDYDASDTIIGIEVLNFSNSKLDLNQIIKLSRNELVAQVSTK